MSDNEKLTPERAVRLLRAKNAELEATVLHTATNPSLLATPGHLWSLIADVALLFSILADHIERSNPDYGPQFGEEDEEDIDDANVREYTEHQREQFRKGFDEGRPK